MVSRVLGSWRLRQAAIGQQRYAYLALCCRKAPMMAEPEELVTTAGRRIQAFHADLAQVIDQLKDAFAQDRLTKEEFDSRVGLAFTARTCAELAALTADLPAGLTAAQPPRKSARAHRRVPMNTAVTGTACVIVAANAGMLIALVTGSGAAVLLMAMFTIIGLAVAIGALIAAG